MSSAARALGVEPVCVQGKAPAPPNLHEVHDDRRRPHAAIGRLDAPKSMPKEMYLEFVHQTFQLQAVLPDALIDEADIRKPWADFLERKRAAGGLEK